MLVRPPKRHSNWWPPVTLGVYHGWIALPKPPVKHHLVPQSYLRRFCEGGHLVGVRRDGKRFRTSPRKIAFEHAFYDLESDAEPSTDVEHFLAHNVDGPAAAAFAELAERGPTAVDLEPVRRFIAFQMVRTQKFRDLQIELHQVAAPLFLTSEAIKRAARRGAIDDSVDKPLLARSCYEKLRASGIDPPDQNSLMRVMLRQADALMGELGALRWQVVAADRPTFLTSDNPVSMFDPQKRIPVGFYGYRPPPGSEVRMPIDPKHVLVGSRTILGDAVMPSQPEFERSMRSDLLRTFYKVVMAPPSLADVHLVLPPKPETVSEPAVSFSRSTGAPPTKPVFPSVTDPLIEDLIELAGQVGLFDDP